jgi:hypothetical protein
MMEDENSSFISSRSHTHTHFSIPSQFTYKEKSM